MQVHNRLSKRIKVELRSGPENANFERPLSHVSPTQLVHPIHGFFTQRTWIFWQLCSKLQATWYDGAENWTILQLISMAVAAFTAALHALSVRYAGKAYLTYTVRFFNALTWSEDPEYRQNRTSEYCYQQKYCKFLPLLLRYNNRSKSNVVRSENLANECACAKHPQ